MLFDHVHVGAGARIHRAILDKNVVLAEGATVGVDREKDLARGFTVTDTRHHRRRQGHPRRAMTRACGRGHAAAASVEGMPAPPARFLVVLDADSTLIRNEVIELIADEAGRGAEVAAATEAAMRGEVDFADEPALARRRRSQACRSRRSPASWRASSRRPGCASSSTPCTSAAGAWASSRADSTRSSTPSPPTSASTSGVRTASRRRTARSAASVDGEIVDAAGKAAALREWAARGAACPLARTIAIGDGANDLEMMAVAGLGVAFNAKPAVRARADLVVGPVDLAEVIPLLPLSRRARTPAWPVSAAGRSVAGMDIILIPGLWLDASSWDDVAPALESRGHTAPIP